jgi:hypothetical protein
MSGDRINIGKIHGTFIKGDVYGDVISHNNSSETIHKQNLAEAAAEIQDLLKQLEKSNPNATELEQASYITIVKPAIKERVIAALKEGGETAIDEFVLDNKYLKVIKSIVKSWMQSSGKK